jgi:hypothetical protein
MKTEYTMNDRIEDRIPEALILIKRGDISSTDISAYDLIANYYGLRPRGRDIYIDYCGKEFVRTKYGFQPALRENLAAQLSKSENRRRKSAASFERQLMKLRTSFKEERTRLNKQIEELTRQLADAKREKWFGLGHLRLGRVVLIKE